MHIMNKFGNISNMDTGTFRNPPEIVLSARKKVEATQMEFANLLGTTQSQISKYESGQVDPPSMLIIQCMNIMGYSLLPVPDISSDMLVKLVRTKLGSPERAEARKAVAILISSLEGQKQTLN